MNIEVTQDKNIIVSAGVRLRTAREQLGLTQQEVAERLCLKVSIIRDIESDKYPVGLSLIFLQGYIRSYSKLVRVPENELLPTIKTLIKNEKVSSIRNLSLINSRKKNVSWITASFTWLILFIMINLIGLWWWQNYKEQREENIIITDQHSTKFNQSDDNVQSTPLNNNHDCTLQLSEIHIQQKAQEILHILLQNKQYF